MGACAAVTGAARTVMGKDQGIGRGEEEWNGLSHRLQLIARHAFCGGGAHTSSYMLVAAQCKRKSAHCAAGM